MQSGNACESRIFERRYALVHASLSDGSVLLFCHGINHGVHVGHSADNGKSLIRLMFVFAHPLVHAFLVTKYRLAFTVSLFIPTLNDLHTIKRRQVPLCIRVYCMRAHDARCTRRDQRR